MTSVAVERSSRLVYRVNGRSLEIRREHSGYMGDRPRHGVIIDAYRAPAGAKADVPRPDPGGDRYRYVHQLGDEMMNNSFVAVTRRAVASRASGTPCPDCWCFRCRS
jgi:hypothetical protein